MRSPEWTERRARFIADHPGGCVICGDCPVHVHHMDYRNLGNEPDGDLVVLCRDHHDWLHDYYETVRAHMTLREATSRYVADGTIDPGPQLDELRNHDRWLQVVSVACPQCGAQPFEACTYLHRGRVRIVTAGAGHRERKAAASRARAFAGSPVEDP